MNVEPCVLCAYAYEEAKALIVEQAAAFLLILMAQALFEDIKFYFVLLLTILAT